MNTSWVGTGPGWIGEVSAGVQRLSDSERFSLPIEPRIRLLKPAARKRGSQVSDGDELLLGKFAQQVEKTVKNQSKSFE